MDHFTVAFVIKCREDGMLEDREIGYTDFINDGRPKIM